MLPPLIGGALSDAFVRRLTSLRRLSVYLSVTYIGPKSRMERPRKTKIGTEVAHVTHDSKATSKVKRSKVKVTRPLWLDVLAGQHGHRVSDGSTIHMRARCILCHHLQAWAGHTVAVCVCVWVCVCGSVTTITRNCMHRSSPNGVCR